MDAWMRASAAMVGMAIIGSVMAATPKQGGATIDGKEVTIAPTTLDVEPLVEGRSVKAYEGKLKENGKPCTAITGYIVSNLPHANWTVTLSFELQNSRPGLSGYGFSVPVKVQVDRPAAGKPVKFTGLGPVWWTPAADGKRDPRDKPTYKVTVDIQKAGVPTLD